MPVLPRRLLVGLCGALLGAAGCGGGAGDAGPSAFASFADSYFDSLYTFAPSQGTAAGFHQYDSKIEDFSAASEKARITTLKGQLAILTGSLMVIKKAALSLRLLLLDRSQQPSHGGA